MERPSAPRPADAPDPVFSVRWSWWRRPASMRWVGDGFDGHMAIAIWTWLRSRPDWAGLWLVLSGSVMTGTDVAPFLGVSCVVVGARLLAIPFRWWGAMLIAGAIAAVAGLISLGNRTESAVAPMLLLAHASATGVASRRPWLAVVIGILLPTHGLVADLAQDGFRDRWIIGSAALFCIVSLPPRAVGIWIAAIFGSAMVYIARTRMPELVPAATSLILVFPATAILRAANEPFGAPDATTRWVAAAHRRPWMAAAAWLGLSFALAMSAYAWMVHPAVPCAMFVASGWTASHLVAGGRSVIGRFAGVALSGPLAGALAFGIVSSPVFRGDAHLVPLWTWTAATAAAAAGCFRWTVPIRRAGRLIIGAATVVGMQSVGLFEALLSGSPGMHLKYHNDWPEFSAGARAGAWIVVCLVVARAARSRTTVPDDHPVHQLRQLREGRAEGA